MSSIGSPTLLHRVRSLFRARDGVLTRKLRREPGGFGLGQVPAKTLPDATTTLVCGYCSTGCGLNVHLRDGIGVNLSPTAAYPVNRGSACPKGWEALAVLDAPDRASFPILKDSDGSRHVVTWQVATETMVTRIKTIQAEHGPESVAFLSTGQIATEEMALLGALAKFGMGMVHGDGNTRQCMASAVVAYKQSFGFDAPPYTYRDLEESDCLVFVGANPCIAHPILWERVTRNPHSPEIIVVDPRRTETATNATLHLPVKPKSDLALFLGLAGHFVKSGWVDRYYVNQHTSGFESYCAFLENHDLSTASDATGLSLETLRDLAGRIRKGRRVSFWWTMGVNQSHQGVKTAQAIINLALLTGNIGRRGTGANSITGQCNAMGSRLFSNTTNLLGGHDFANAEHREKVARVLDIPEDRIPRTAGWAYDQILEGVRTGKIRALWIIGTNPAHSWIARGEFDQLIKKLDFLVVQDMYHSTETARVADLLLPAAGWGEKEGTFINSERRIGLLKKVRYAPGKALADLHIFRLIAHAYGCGAMFDRWISPEAIFQILKRLSSGQPCDFSGIADTRQIDAAGGIQWPYRPGGEDKGTERRLFADGRFFHADGRARFIFEEPRPHPESTDSAFPFTLLTGRGSAAQWHTQTRTAKSEVLRRLYRSDRQVEIHPDDALALDIRPEATIVITSRRASITAKAFVTATVPRGQIFMAMHDAATNLLTAPVFDPESRQPSYKATAVSVRPEVPETTADTRRRWIGLSRLSLRRTKRDLSPSTSDPVAAR